jgi:hypothetical protein
MNNSEDAESTVAHEPEDRGDGEHPTIYCGGSVRFPIRTACLKITDVQMRARIKKLAGVIRRGVGKLRESATQPAANVQPETVWYVDIDEREFVMVWRILCSSAHVQR